MLPARRAMTAATSCMASSERVAAKASARRPLRFLGPVAVGASAGSSVHGWMMTASRAHLRMMSPDPLPLRGVKPLRWSACRCETTMAWSFPSVTRAMSSAIVRSRGVPLRAAAVEPKSIRTWRGPVR